MIADRQQGRTQLSAASADTGVPGSRRELYFLLLGAGNAGFFFFIFFFLGERLIQMSQCQFSPQRQSLLSLYVGGNVWEWGGRGLSLEEIDVACDVHT